MVAPCVNSLIGAATLWERLKPVDRARVGLALLAFVLLLAAIVILVMMAGRMVRREVRKPLPPVRDLTDAWARKPLAPRELSTAEDASDPDDLEQG
jgi:hypothetical protein